MDILKDFDEITKLFIWLYLPTDIESNHFEPDTINFNIIIDNTINNLYIISKKFSIPSNIILRKIIEYLKIKKFNKQQIIDKLYVLEIINIHSLNYVMVIIDEVFNSNVNVLNNCVMQNLINLSKQYNYKINCDHSGYPELHPELGRPRINWKECYYSECHEKFNDSNLLRNHLINLNKYTYGFHSYHEDIVIKLNLTPEKILHDKITKCPSIVCDQGNGNFTPEELCNHFKILGIPPFWEQGMIINNPKKKILIDDYNNKDIFKSDECIVCCEDNIKPSLLFLPCYHCIICANCYKPINKCPICREDIVNIIPI